jgi:hypothetical protein
MIASTGSLRLVDKLVGLGGLIRQDPDGVLEDVPLLPSHEGIVGERQDAISGLDYRTYQQPIRTVRSGRPWMPSGTPTGQARVLRLPRSSAGTS